MTIPKALDIRIHTHMIYLYKNICIIYVIHVYTNTQHTNDSVDGSDEDDDGKGAGHGFDRC